MSLRLQFFNRAFFTFRATSPWERRRSLTSRVTLSRASSLREKKYLFIYIIFIIIYIYIPNGMSKRTVRYPYRTVPEKRRNFGTVRYGIADHDLDYRKSKQHSSHVNKNIKTSCKYFKSSIRCKKSSIYFSPYVINKKKKLHHS
ncbi:unnamed protein product [Musa textilis]